MTITWQVAHARDGLGCRSSLYPPERMISVAWRDNAPCHPVPLWWAPPLLLVLDLG